MEDSASASKSCLRLGKKNLSLLSWLVILNRRLTIFYFHLKKKILKQEEVYDWKNHPTGNSGAY